ncbi:hypothetical protein AO1008_02364 [Aspergillus oryzae 100-8]|uniref:Uncharacterized protein n=1 Tax=Aspergillus oryzae (strain 3.042) TaxID=1160506 RepID=I8IDF8_ASPO3|nr:hypothetical protein Ao3042_08036 [Aspergillus oryzae 3.042]KDE76264.1 hypothetical protein AO1008_02364 [Aspergillus oryzae 100-8]|eukprot:EIT75891.1 hypothetical protein Ao3042_08036 [Aspergillus oryzae 3.042]
MVEHYRSAFQVLCCQVVVWRCVGLELYRILGVETSIERFHLLCIQFLSTVLGIYAANYAVRLGESTGLAFSVLSCFSTFSQKQCRQFQRSGAQHHYRMNPLLAQLLKGQTLATSPGHASASATSCRAYIQNEARVKQLAELWACNEATIVCAPLRCEPSNEQPGRSSAQTPLAMNLAACENKEICSA